MLALVIVVIPYAVLIGGFVLLFRAHRERPKTASKIPKYCLGASAALAGIVLVVGFSFMFSSRSGMAGVGLLFVPIYAIGAAIAGYTVSWSLLALSTSFPRARTWLFADKSTPIVTSVAAGILLTSFVAAYMVGTRLWLLSAAESPDTQVQRLHEIADAAIAENDTEALQRLAKNSAVPDELLRQVYKHCADARETRTKTLCYSVFRNLAWNKTTPAALLHELVDKPESAIRRGVARNQGTSPQILEQLVHDEDSGIRMSLAVNPNLPLPALKRLVSDEHSGVRSLATREMKRRKKEREK